MNHQNKTIETSISLNSILKGTSVFLAASALILGGFFIAYAAGTFNVIPQELSSTLATHPNASADATRNGGVVTLLANEHADDWSNASEARITIQAEDVGITTLNDLVSMSWDTNVLSGYLPHVDIYLDLNNNGAYDSGVDDVLVFEYAKVDNSNCDNSPYPTGSLNTFGNKGTLVGSSYGWLNSGDAGPCGGATFYSHSLSDWKAGQTENGKTINGSSKVLRMELEVDAWISNSQSEVSNIVVNDVSYYGSIQSAIDVASSGDTIQVAAGTYNEQLVVNKDVTISGQTGAIIQPTGNDDAWDIQFVNGGSGATLEGFTLDFNGAANNRLGRGIGVSDFNGPTVTDVTIQNNDITMGVGTGAATVGLEGVGIQTGKNADVSGLQILNNDFHGGSVAITDGNTQGEEGIYINPNNGAGLITVSGNTFDGQLFTGISVEAGNVAVSENTITRPSIVQNTQGIRVNDFVGNQTYNITASNNAVSGFANGFRLGSGSEGGSTLTVTLSDNTISGNTRGIWVRNDAVVTANNKNSITGNTSFGAEILAGSDGTLNAANNWWGASTGPTHASNPGGSGDAVSDNVSFSPWYTDAAMTTLSGLLGKATIDPANPNTVDPLFTPQIDSTLVRGSEVYLGRTTTYTGSPLGTDGDTIKWKVTIDGPAALTPNMVDLDEVGFNDPDGDGTVLGTYHYPFTGSDDLVATGSCDLSVEDGETHSNTCIADIGFSLDTNDVFTNADKIKFNSGAPAGSYTITYELVNTAGGLVVGTHVVSVVVVNTAITVTANAQSKTYGDDDPVALTYQITGSLEEGDTELEGTLSRDAGENVGTYGITIGSLDSANPNYDITFVGADLTINAKPITVTAVTDTKIYDGATNSAVTPTFPDGSLVGDDTADFIQTYDTEDVGTGKTLTPSGVVNDGNSGSNYVVTPVNDTTGVITPASLTITADNKSKVYGTENPGLTASYVGFVGGEDESVLDISVLLETTAVDASPVGTYPITASGAADVNYIISFVSGTLTVTTAPITVTADDKSKNYGEADPALTYTNDPLVGSDAFTGSLSRDAGENIGDYAITQGTLALSSNYVLTFTPATLTINLNGFNATIALTQAGEWALISAPVLLSEAPTVTDNNGGAVALLVYRNGAFVVPSEGDDELVNPLSAFYVKTTNTGVVGLKSATISSPTQVSRQLSAGWNLVGTNNDGLAVNEFSSIQNTPTNAGMVTLFVPDTYNSRKDTGYNSWDDDANHDLNANPITALPDNDLSAYDGYWVFMDAAKAFVKNL